MCRYHQHAGRQWYDFSWADDVWARGDAGALDVAQVKHTDEMYVWAAPRRSAPKCDLRPRAMESAYLFFNHPIMRFSCARSPPDSESLNPGVSTSVTVLELFPGLHTVYAATDCVQDFKRELTSGSTVMWGSDVKMNCTYCVSL